MINFNINFNESEDIYDEVSAKIPLYEVDTKEAFSYIEDYDISIKTCCLIPISDIVLMVEVEEIDREGKLHFNLFGFTELRDIDINTNNVMLCELSCLDTRIIDINQFMKLNIDQDVSGGDFTPSEKVYYLEGIHHICSSLLNCFFCRRLFGTDSSTYLDGKMSLSLT